VNADSAGKVCRIHSTGTIVNVDIALYGSNRRSTATPDAAGIAGHFFHALVLREREKFDAKKPV
jgi:hypothetical protein